MNPEDVKVTLKTGEEMRATSVLATLEYLRAMLERPRGEEQVTDLYRLCADPTHRVSPDFLPEFLRGRVVLPQPDGCVVPDAQKRAVLLAAYTTTTEGVVLVNPVVPSERNRDALSRAEQSMNARTDRFFRTGEWPDPTEDTPHGGHGR